jgi:phenylpropionate dioxygenase-like ring-hydroxylating dioxygenase large terminal subunit
MGEPLERFLSPAERTALRVAIEAAGPFPAIASQAFFDLEAEQVFARNWLAIGMAPSLPNSGDVHPVWIFGHPIVMVRDGAGGVRVFHNIRALDGRPVVTTRSSGLVRLEAPHNGWLYDLEGRLIGAP